MSGKSIRIPQDIPEYSKNILYFDESGIADLKDLQTKYFILTCIITDEISFQKYNPYYFQLKYKYFDSYAELHSHDLFYRPTKTTLEFISELLYFIDNIPFCFLCVAIKKKPLLDRTKKVRTRRPLDTTLNQALSIYTKYGLKRKDFFREEISSIIKKISNFEMLSVDRYFPLEKSLQTVLERYNSRYRTIINTKEEKEYELFLEDSPNKRRILKYIEKYQTSQREITGTLSNISFPTKKAKYLGLELADIISFGFNLYINKRLRYNKAYIPIWNVINKRSREFKKKKDWDSFVML